MDAADIIIAILIFSIILMILTVIYKEIYEKPVPPEDKKEPMCRAPMRAGRESMTSAGRAAAEGPPPVDVSRADYDSYIQDRALEDDVIQGHQRYLKDIRVVPATNQSDRMELDHPIDSNYQGLGALMMRQANASGHAGKTMTSDGARQVPSVDVTEMRW